MKLRLVSGTQYTMPHSLFLVLQPCSDLWTSLGDTVDSLINCEVLRVPVVSFAVYLLLVCKPFFVNLFTTFLPQSPTSSFGGRRIPRPAFDSDEDDAPGDIMLQVSVFNSN